MRITRKSLEEAVEQGILEQRQAGELYDFLRARPDSGPGFNFTNVLYYLGGLIAIGAMTLFMTLGWESFGGMGIVAVSLVYAALGLWLARRFQQRGLSIPAGICATFAVALTPLAVYGLQQAAGWWPDSSQYAQYHRQIKWNWIYMELATLLTGAITLRVYRYPFLVMPVAVTLWYLSMDLAPMLAGDVPAYEIRPWVSLGFGLLILALAFRVDIRSRNTADYAFWLYIFGTMAFWGGLTSQHDSTELSRFVYFGINLLMIGVGVLLVRRVFVVFGAIGCAIYLEHLASRVFQDSWLFPVVLTAAGLGIVYLGVLWQKNEAAITQRARGLLPARVRELLDSRTGG